MALSITSPLLQPWPFAKHLTTFPTPGPPGEGIYYNRSAWGQSIFKGDILLSASLKTHSALVFFFNFLIASNTKMFKN